MLYAFPYYVAVQSAGNTRGFAADSAHSIFQSVGGSTSNFTTVSSSTSRETNGGADGFDCIALGGTHKNGILVGAADLLPSGWADTADVTIRAESSLGPTDDGRIKPDLVAGGDKTSQATSVVTGVLALLKEHYQNLYAKQPLASTLKACLIHTADEAGTTPGPDYTYGWGLVNTLSAAEQLQNADYIHPHFEDTLLQGNSKVYYFKLDTNTFKATAVWTDPEATPVPFALNPSLLNNPQKMLVNDVDLRLQALQTSQIYLPYTLSVSNPSAAATVGDNITDNVEQIDLDNPTKGWYKLTVSHKGSLKNGAQAFSLFVTGARKSLAYENGSWLTAVPDASTENLDVYIAPNSTLTFSTGFKAHDLYIGSNAHVTIQ